MDIQVLNNDLSMFGMVTKIESMDFVRAFNSKGSFRLKINANNKNAKYIKIDKILYVDNAKIGYIDKVTLDRKGGSATEYLIAEGVEIKDRLNRIIYPDASLNNDSYTDEYLEVVVKSMIQKNASAHAVLQGVAIASASRQIPNLKVAPNQNRGTKVDYSARYKDLSTEIYSLLASQKMGLKAEIDFVSNAIVFDVALGNDLKASEGEAGGIVLSLDTKTALEIVDTDDRLTYRNLSVTAGQGEGAQRTIQEVYTGDAEPTGFTRMEVFTDARDAKSDDELATRGGQKLADISKTRAISVKANNLGSYEVGDDYDLGDYISVDTRDGLYEAQVVKIKYKYDKAGVPQIDISLNFDINDTLLSAISAKHMDYDALVASQLAKTGVTAGSYTSVNVTVDAQGRITAISSGTNIVKEAKLTSAQSTIPLDNLDINAHGGFYEFWLSGKTNAFADVALYINNETTATNYYSQEKLAFGTTLLTGNTNNARIGTMANNPQGTIHGYIFIDPVSGYAVIQAHTTLRNATNMSVREYDVVSSVTFTNITELTFDAGDKTFSADTTAKIIKRG